MKKLKYDNLTWIALIIAIVGVALLEIFIHISAWKLLVISVSSVVLTLHQTILALYESCLSLNQLCNEVNIIAKLMNKKAMNLNDEKRNAKLIHISQMSYVLALVILIVGLSIDIDYHNSAISDTLTLFSLALAFLSMYINKFNVECQNMINSAAQLKYNVERNSNNTDENACPQNSLNVSPQTNTTDNTHYDPT